MNVLCFRTSDTGFAETSKQARAAPVTKREVCRWEAVPAFKTHKAECRVIQK